MQAAELTAEFGIAGVLDFAGVNAASRWTW
jgi:hypothetical protein